MQDPEERDSPNNEDAAGSRADVAAVVLAVLGVWAFLGVIGFVFVLLQRWFGGTDG